MWLGRIDYIRSKFIGWSADLSICRLKFGVVASGLPAFRVDDFVASRTRAVVLRYILTCKCCCGSCISCKEPRRELCDGTCRLGVTSELLLDWA